MARLRTFFLVVVMGSLAVIAGQEGAQAAEWSLEPSMSAKGEYHSNLLMISGPQRSTYAYWLSPAARFTGATESLQVNSRLAMDYAQYYGGRDTSIINVYFPVSLQYRDQRSMWGFEGGLTRDNTLRTELLQTGLVLSFAQRNLWSAAPSWTYNVTERLSAATSYQYQNVTYENDARSGLVGYEIHTGSETLSYKIRDTDSVQITGSYTRFLVPQANDLVSNNYAVQIGGAHAFSERTTLTASGGPQFLSNSINTMLGSPEDSSIVWVFNGRVTTTLERAQVTLDIGRSVMPSGFGVLIRTDRLGATANYELTDKLSISLSGQASLVNPAQSTTLFRALTESRFFTITPQVSWRLGEFWKADAGYTYSRREITGFDQSAESHAARFLVTYFPPKFSAGR